MEEASNGVTLDFADVESILLATLSDVWRDFIGHLPFLFAGLAVLLLTWLASYAGSALVARLVRHARMRNSLRDLIRKLTTLGIWVVGMLLTAMIVFPGLTPARALGGLGLASVAVGFAFKDIFENFFAGVMLLWRFPFENDDYIECENVVGRVEDITVRMTMVRSVDGELILLPNSFLFKNPVRVLTNPTRRRFDLVAGVAYGEDALEARKVIDQAVQGCASVAAEPAPEVNALSFGASSVDFEVIWWSDPSPQAARASRGEVVTAIKRALDEAGIEIPFPHRTLTFKEPPSLVIASRETDET